MFIKIKRNITAYKYIGSGLLKTLAQTLAGFLVLLWVLPRDLGQWQSFTVFAGYTHILTLGVTSGLNRELPYWLGKGDKKKGLKLLKTAGYFVTILSIALLLLIVIVALFLNFFEVFNLNQTLMMIFAFSIGALSIQTNFLGATYRSSHAFNQLSKIQLYTCLFYLLLIPLIYLFKIWGYIAYQGLIAFILYLGYRHFKPYKVKYAFNKKNLYYLISIGFPMYFWNYMAELTKTVPRLVLVLFGTPYLVGLFAPAGSINAAMLNLPAYTNRYLFPTMSYRFGQNNNLGEIYQYAIKAASMLFVVMLLGAAVLCLLLPYIFPLVFPEYVQGVVAAQIILFAGVFYSVNALFHNTLNSLKMFASFKYIVSFRVISIISSIYIIYSITDNLLFSAALGSAISEFLNLLNYLYFLRKSTRA